MIPFGNLEHVLTRACSLLLAVPVVLLLESNTVSENIFRHKSYECALWEEGSVLIENCHHPLDDSEERALSGGCALPSVCLFPLGPTCIYPSCLYALIVSVYQPKHLIMSFWTNRSQNHLTLRMNPWISASNAGAQ